LQAAATYDVQGTTCNIQRATCNVQHATFDVQGTTCNMQYTTCKMQRTTCDVQHATCNMRRATYNVQHTTCNIQHATCNMQRATYNVQHTTCNIQRATCDMQRATCEVQPATWTFGCQARSAEREVAEERRKRTWEALAAQQQLVQAVAERDRLQNLSDTACATLNQVAVRASIYSSAVGQPRSALLGLCCAQRRADRPHWSWTAVRACVGRVRASGAHV
jgi:hypothetical protein